MKKKYKKLIKKTHRKYKNNIIDKLQNVNNSNPLEFWKLLKDLQNQNSNEDKT